MLRKVVPDIVREQDLIELDRQTTVRQAVLTMTKRRIGAVMVVEQEQLIGIFTERDVLTRVVAAGRDPDATTIGEVMTADPDTLSGDDTAAHALEMMREHGYRHLPVVKDGRPVGIVSVRDLYGAITKQLEDDIRNRDAFIRGEGYGLGA